MASRSALWRRAGAHHISYRALRLLRSLKHAQRPGLRSFFVIRSPVFCEGLPSDTGPPPSSTIHASIIESLCITTWQKLFSVMVIRSPPHFYFLSVALWHFKGSFQVNRDPQVSPQGGALNAVPFEANVQGIELEVSRRQSEAGFLQIHPYLHLIPAISLMSKWRCRGVRSSVWVTRQNHVRVKVGTRSQALAV